MRRQILRFPLFPRSLTEYFTKSIKTRDRVANGLPSRKNEVLLTPPAENGSANRCVAQSIPLKRRREQGNRRVIELSCTYFPHGGIDFNCRDVTTNSFRLRESNRKTRNALSVIGHQNFAASQRKPKRVAKVGIFENLFAAQFVVSLREGGHTLLRPARSKMVNLRIWVSS